MRILWISSIAWKENSTYPYPIDGPGAVSGSMLEQNLITGLEKNGCEITILNTYPYKEKKNRKGFEWHHIDGRKDYCIGSKKNKYLNYFYEQKMLSRRIKKENLSHFDAIIGYLIHKPFLAAIKSAKIKNKVLTTILVCPDLPDMMDLNSSFIKRIVKRIELKHITKLYKYIDKYVLLSRYMSEKIPVKECPTMIMEGVCNPLEERQKVRKQKEFVIMYAGSLQRRFGIENLIEAFKQIPNEDFRLHIYGSGTLSNYIKSKCCEDKRIVFYGFVNHEDILDAEQNASLLVNVRDPDEAFTKYSFPSKTFEYILSGTPFLTTELKGIPSDYYNYIFSIKDNEIETIRNAIYKIYKMPLAERIKKTSGGINYIKNNKNPDVQSRRLLNFIKGS